MSQNATGDIIVDALTEFIAWLFVAANAGRLLGYLPQVVAAWRCRNGAAAVSRMTWGYFAFAHFTGALYGLVVIHDLKMAYVFLGNAAVCILLVSIVTWKKRQHRQAVDSLEMPTVRLTRRTVRGERVPHVPSHHSPTALRQMANDSRQARERPIA